MTVIVTEQEAKNQDEDNGPGCSKNFDQKIKRFKETGGQIIPTCHLRFTRGN